MAQKSLGYVQLVWTCPNCLTKNPGNYRFCKNCGASMPENVKFEQPIKEEIITDQALIDEAKKGPDIFCGYCGSRNPVTAETCSTCGADLDEGTKRTAGTVYQASNIAHNDTIRCNVCGVENDISNLTCTSCGSPLQTTTKIEPDTSSQQTTPPKAKMGKGCMIAIVLLILAAIIGFFLMTSKKEARSVVVSNTAWQTSIQVLGLIDKQASTWRDSIPASSRILSCSERVRERSDTYVSDSEEVCGEPYFIDKGNGFSEKVQDCYYEVYDDYCTYAYQDWDVISVLSDQGNDINPLIPKTTLSENQRLGNQSVSYSISFTDSAGKVYTYVPSSLEEYRQFGVNDHYTIELNGFGSIVKMEKQ